MSHKRTPREVDPSRVERSNSSTRALADELHESWRTWQHNKTARETQNRVERLQQQLRDGNTDHANTHRKVP